MGAVLGVDAGVGKAESLDGTVVEEVFGDDLFDVASVDVAVPDGFGIDDDDRAVFTLVETAGFVGTDVVLETGFLNGVLKADFSFLLPSGRQLGRVADSSRSLVQMKMWWSNFGNRSILVLLMRCNSLYLFSLLKVRCTGVFETIEA